MFAAARALLPHRILCSFQLEPCTGVFAETDVDPGGSQPTRSRSRRCRLIAVAACRPRVGKHDSVTNAYASPHEPSRIIALVCTTRRWSSPTLLTSFRDLSFSILSSLSNSIDKRCCFPKSILQRAFFVRRCASSGPSELWPSESDADMYAEEFILIIVELNVDSNGEL